MSNVFDKLAAEAKNDEKARTVTGKKQPKRPGRKPAEIEVHKLSVNLPVPTYDKLKDAAYDRRMTMKDLLVEMIDSL